MFIIKSKIGQWTTVCELRNMINHHTHRPANTCNHSMFVEINPENDESLAQQKKEA